MQHLIEDAVRFVGWATLKAVTGGRYKSSATSLLLEGGIGLLLIVGALWIAYRWVPV